MPQYPRHSIHTIVRHELARDPDPPSSDVSCHTIPILHALQPPAPPRRPGGRGTDVAAVSDRARSPPSASTSMAPLQRRGHHMMHGGQQRAHTCSSRLSVTLFSCRTDSPPSPLVTRTVRIHQRLALCSVTVSSEQSTAHFSLKCRQASLSDQMTRSCMTHGHVSSGDLTGNSCLLTHMSSLSRHLTVHSDDYHHYHCLAATQFWALFCPPPTAGHRAVLQSRRCDTRSVPRRFRDASAQVTSPDLRSPLA